MVQLQFLITKDFLQVFLFNLNSLFNDKARFLYYIRLKRQLHFELRVFFK